MRVLIHVCCGPCLLYPLRVLRREGIRVSGYFHNPNIHPYREFRRRIRALVQVADRKEFPVEIDREYGLVPYLRRVVNNEEQRCAVCYEMRLEKTAIRAAELGVDGFTTTLLYSRYQKHELIRQTGQAMARRYGVAFLYRDFRQGWQQGIDEAVALDLYRQPYCGCIYSEQERYDKKLRKQLRQRSRRAAEGN